MKKVKVYYTEINRRLGERKYRTKTVDVPKKCMTHGIGMESKEHLEQKSMAIVRVTVLLQ